MLFLLLVMFIKFHYPSNAGKGWTSRWHYHSRTAPLGHQRRRSLKSLAVARLTAKMAAAMLRSLSKLGRPSTKLILNNNLLSPGCVALQHR